MKRLLPIMLLALAIAFLTAYSPVIPAQGEDKLLIVATFSSLVHEVDLLLGDQCPREYHVLAQGEIDPHTYSLTPRDLEALRKADLILSTEHTPFEQRILEQISRGELEADYLGIVSLEGIRLTRLPGTASPNAHFPIYHPDNYRVFLTKLAQSLKAHCPAAAGTIAVNLENALQRLEEIERGAAGGGELGAVVSSPPAQYALEGLGVRVLHVVAPEPEAGVSPNAMEEALRLLGEEGVVAGVLYVTDSRGGRLPSTSVDEWLWQRALEAGVRVIWVPHPLEEGSVLDKLESIVLQLRETRIEDSAGMVGGGNYRLLAGGVLSLAVILVLLWGSQARVLPMAGEGRRRALVMALLLLASGAAVLVVCGGSEACSLAWVGVMAGSGAALGGLSAVLGVRRMFFLAAAVPHVALVSASLGLLAEVLVGGWFKAWALGFNVLLLTLAWRAMVEPGVSDRVVALLVGVTGSVSVVVLYHLSGVLGVGYSVSALVLGDPLLAGVGGAAAVAWLGVSSLLYVALTFREHVVIGVNRPQALLSGLAVGLYDASLVLLLAVASTLLLDVVGFILAHILFLLPGSAALMVSRGGVEVLLTSVYLSLSSALLGLALSLATGLSPAGLLGLVLLAQLALLHAFARG